MAHHFANEIPPHLSMWQRVRQYAVPPSMIETATARRAAGDWAGACAAARVDVDLDLRAVRNRHGTELLTRLRADLRRLAPDLLRWHMPRIAPDGRLRPGLTLSLVRYERDAITPLHLVVRTPPAWADAGQRMSLALWDGALAATAGRRYAAPHPHPHPDRRFRLDLHRHLWDASRSGELGLRSGAGGVTSPEPGWATGRWAPEAELLLRAEGLPRGAFAVRLGARGHRAAFALVAPDAGHAPTLRPLGDALPPREVAALPVLPEAAARTLPDLELLRAGLVTSGCLHPLVAAALPMFAAQPSAAGQAPKPADPHRVECRGEVHRIALRDGVLTAVDHDPDQLRREELLVAFGGPPLPCLRAIDAVHRSPEALPAVRERLGHGDVTGALAVVEGLLGTGAVLRDGPLRDALESAAARRVNHGLFRAGLVSGDAGAWARSGTGRGSADDADYGDDGDDGRRGPGAARRKAARRPRIDRHTPVMTRRERGTRFRPRTGLAC
ncbi:hypothetical protein DCW30_17945 [Streptomyces alfalfae]|uniref:Uncharacterized protein n=1 Tax=Streptomyces alfalfae TaxID=1642299 RepID=A0ABM6H1B8_9ACTN|nr:hypothetical protein [Streptomyces alfalfae]APY90038.1 hypothetical protein A7J05_34120 [Streptomyces alfalfae]AYA20499.1 hypothetical protein D3X13_33430 [Streptomyces fradiae]RXX42864.1 hypothetical protein DCW30_17945 [Streptomyces alfalfae]RZM86308.1 hypothetical protein D4104_29545 [Streptomyces alfalfae]